MNGLNYSDVHQIYTIGKPTIDVPDRKRGGQTWQEIWDATKKLQNGQWLPIKFKSTKTADRLCLAARSHRTLRIEVRRRKQFVYLKLSDAK